MPLFDFTCDDCGREFETLVSSATDSVECPDCQSSDVSRMLSLPARPVVKAGGGGGCGEGPPCGRFGCQRGG